jgi:hypothetical protein
MQELEGAIRDQVRAAREALEVARAADDDYLVAIHLSELHSLARTATEHGLALDVPGFEPVPPIDLLDPEQARAC